MATFTTIVSKPVTFTTTTNVVNLTAHGFNANVAVKFSVITTTTGITVNTFYYVIADTVNTFKLSNTINGTVLPLTTNGTGTLSAVSRSDLATTISATNNIKSTTSFKFLPEIFKFSGIKNMLECISFEWIIGQLPFKKFSSINAIKHATFDFLPEIFKFSGITVSKLITYKRIPLIDIWKKFTGTNTIQPGIFEWIVPQLLIRKFTGTNTTEFGTFKFLPEIFKFTGINLSNIITYKYIPLISIWKKFTGVNTIEHSTFEWTINQFVFRKFTGVANILEALSIIIPPSREIGTRFTFAGISKLLIPLSIIIPPSREIGTRFTFAGLGTIIASTAKISDFPSTLKYSALNVIATSNAFISDFTEDLKFSALNVIATSNVFISDFTTRITFSGMTVLVSSSVQYIQSEVYAKFSGMKVVKVITTKAKYWKDDVLPQLPIIKQLIEFWS